MNKVEISHLSFLINSIINKPSITIYGFKFVDEKFKSDSVIFNKSINILKKITNNLKHKNSSRNQLIKQILFDVKRVKNRSKLEKDIFQLIIWSIENQNYISKVSPDKKETILDSNSPNSSFS